MSGLPLAYASAAMPLLPRQKSLHHPSQVRPPEVAEFVGRDIELTGLFEKLATRHLAVIAGMPGVGKTALASELARRKDGPRVLSGMPSMKARA